MYPIIKKPTPYHASLKNPKALCFQVFTLKIKILLKLQIPLQNHSF